MSPKTPTASQLEARRQMDMALEAIEATQRLIGEACQLLCPLTPLCRDWERLGKLYDKVNAEWHRLNLVRNGGRYDLDTDAKARLLAKLAVKAPETVE